jgi:hypothetical protein
MLTDMQMQPPRASGRVGEGRFSCFLLRVRGKIYKDADM